MILLIFFMSVIARMAGGGLLAEKMPKPLPEIVFGTCFGIFNFIEYKNALIAVLVSAWCYGWMETGHGTVLQWGRDPSQATSGRVQRLTPFVNFIANGLGYEIGSIQYCRLFMAVKGFLIGIPVGGLPLAILWPLSYEIGYRFNKNEIAEYLTGLFSGATILVFYKLIGG